MSGRAEGNLINAKDVGKANGDTDHVDVFTEDGVLDQWEMNADDDDEVIPMGQQINKSSHKGTQQCMMFSLVCLFICLFVFNSFIDSFFFTRY